MEAGQRVGRYTVVGPIGRGGMGGVYHVVDETGAAYALKAPIHDIDGTGNVTKRFAREANAMRMLEHPNLVAAVDVFVEGGALYLVMERVVGRTLLAAIKAGLGPRQALVFVRQILDGVGLAHAAGFVHRDLKPENILLADMGGWERVKIIDFGLVKLVGDAADAFGSGALTRTGMVSGTPAYMAPEQALGRTIDARADLYAVGVILYEALAGRLPFTDRDPMIVLRQQVKMPPPKLVDLVGYQLWCTGPMLSLVEHALEKKPEDRFQTAAEMIDAVDRAFQSIDHVR